MGDEIKKGDLVVYEPLDTEGTPYKRELGVVKSVNEERGTAFVAYNLGDTCACTDIEILHKIGNAYAAKGLAKRAEQLGARLDDLCEGCEDWGGE